MATSEDDIRKGLAILIQRYGELTTSEVKKLLGTVIAFDEDDLIPSATRPTETLVMQRIGNVVSHQTEAKKVYNGSYEIDKTEPRNTKFKALIGLEGDNERRVLDNQELDERRNLVSQFTPKKVDWNQVNSRQSVIGDAGEKYALKYETGRVQKFTKNPDDLERIIHVSAIQGDGAGFDILSIDENGKQVYIEVKTTEYNSETPFYMSENEKNFFELHNGCNDTYIYRIYNFNESTLRGEIEIIKCEELLSDYTFDPISFIVHKK